MRREQQVSNGGRPIAARDDLGNGVRVPERLRHLLVLDEEMFHMYPEARKRLVRRPLALRDLVFVMREDQVDATRVNIDRRLAQEPQRHRRAFEMPPGPSRWIDHVPARLSRLARLPQHEVAGVLLRVVIGIDASAVLHSLFVEMRELPVVGHGRDLEIDGSVADVGMAVPGERLDQIRHRAKIRLVGRARVLFDLLEAERAGILTKGLDVLLGVRTEIHPGLLRTDDRAIVDIGEVHHMMKIVAEQVLQRPAQHVDANEGAEIADMAARVDRRTARVHPHGVAARRSKSLFRAGQGVV